MGLIAAFTSSLPSIGWILAAMAIVAAIEAAIPLRARNAWSRAHLAPNLALTGIALAANLAMNAILLVALDRLHERGFGLLATLGLSPFAAGAVAVAALDFSFYLLHVWMHRIPGWWRYHAVHHADPMLDVTTTIRQHPVETLLRFAVIAVFSLVLVPSPLAFAIYRAGAALIGLLEHANLRVPQWLDGALALVTTWPNLHKIHHSRVPAQTDSNYGNILSLWDRLFGTLTPSLQGTNVDYGLEGRDDPAAQTLAGLLLAPWRRDPSHARAEPEPSAPVAAARPISRPFGG